MKTGSTHYPAGIGRTLLGALALVAIFAVASPSIAAATTTAANAVITNEVTVNYADTGGTAMPFKTATVDVTVSLKAAIASLSAPSDGSTASSVALDYTYTITSNANGSDTYNLTAPYTAGTATLSGHTEVFRNAADDADITSITLGATSLISYNGIDTITVPSDGTADSSINGIEAGDTLFIDSAAYTVASIVDNDDTSTTSTITLTAAYTGSTTEGTQIGERKTFFSRTTPVATVAGNYTLTVTANSAADPTKSITDATTTTVILPSLTVTKYVLNVTPATTGNANGTGGTVINTVTYYTGGVTGKPGETLEYVIAIVNGAGAAQASDVVISDSIPSYTTYEASSMKVDPNNTGWVDINDGANDSDAGEYDGTDKKVYIYAGAGGDDGTAAATYNDGTGGTLPASTTTYGLFQVKINE